MYRRPADVALATVVSLVIGPSYRRGALDFSSSRFSLPLFFLVRDLLDKSRFSPRFRRRFQMETNESRRVFSTTCIIFQYRVVNLWRRGGEEMEGRWRGREKDSPSDHARLNFRVGGNGWRWSLNGPEGHVVVVVVVSSKFPNRSPCTPDSNRD